MTLAACLIVKNEARLVRRCLDSVRGLVDAVVIVDTGPTEDTLDVMRGLDYPVPIHLHQRLRLPKKHLTPPAAPPRI